MPLHWRPVGPLPVATYWRRRAGVLAVVVVVGFLVSALAGLRGAGPDRLRATGAPPATATPTAGRTASASGAASAAPAAAAVPACPDQVATVNASTDASVYPPGSTARLTLSIANTGSTACRRAVGRSAVEVVVTSGSDRIWSSDDCAPGGDAGETVLQPGQAVTTTVTWPGTRSAPGCPPDHPAARPGTYRITARVGGLQVPGAVFRIGG